MDNEAYNEALERARRILCNIPEGSAFARDIETIFPELRESEDERMVRKIESFLSASGSDYFSNDEWREIEVWLEKQKEQKHPNGCFTCDEYKKGYEEGRRNGFTAGYNKAMKEVDEQKENPKSSDSIPSDCTSDAKCENSWHKVGDSLPDNGRLVLAQDCLGNILLARYDGEGNWEVSVYDNDDYYCRNTITKWCEIPSEKQKEQKPAWSEKDGLTIADLINFFEGDPLNCSAEEMVQRIKSLRPSWKPSEEQMEELNKVRTLNPGLDALYQQLKNM